MRTTCGKADVVRPKAAQGGASEQVRDDVPGVSLPTAVLLVALTFGIPLFLTGCKRYEPESSEQEARAYYRDKYGKDVRVDDSHGLGNYGLFGYEYRGMEYVMADGCSVIYLDDEGIYKDNAQSEEVERAAVGFVEQALDAVDGALVAPKITSVGDEVGYETYEGEGICWHGRYDGDIDRFLRDERPPLWLDFLHSGQSYGDGAFSYEVAYGSEAQGEVERAYTELGKCLDLRGVTVAIIDANKAGSSLADGTLTLFDDGLVCLLDFYEDSAGQVVANRYKPVLYEVLDGVSVASDVPRVALEQGDVSLKTRTGPFLDWTVKAGTPAKDADDMSYFVHNDTGQSIVHVRGVESYATLCGPHEHRSSVRIREGDVLFVGNEDDIRPSVEIVDVSEGRVRARYRTHFKGAITSIGLRVIGMAYKEGSTTSQTTEFKARRVSETEDGWLFEVEIPTDAVPSNTLHFQFSYNGAEESSVQIEKDVELVV